MVPDILPKRGRPGVTMLLTIERELTINDIYRLALMDDKPKVGQPIVQRLRASHHRQAQLLAAGRSPEDVANLTGVTRQRIYDLRNNDPAFQNLIAYYQQNITEVFVEDQQRIHSKLVDGAEMSIDEMNDRLEDPEKRKQIPFGELHAYAARALDRTVLPPKQAQSVNPAPGTITLKMGPRDLDPKIVDVEHEDIVKEKVEPK